MPVPWFVYEHSRLAVLLRFPRPVAAFPLLRRPLRRCRALRYSRAGGGADGGLHPSFPAASAPRRGAPLVKAGGRCVPSAAGTRLASAVGRCRLAAGS